MDETHHGRVADSKHDAGFGETEPRGWRRRLDQLHKNKTLRMHVRCWLLGLVSIGPIR